MCVCLFYHVLVIFWIRLPTPFPDKIAPEKNNKLFKTNVISQRKICCFKRTKIQTFTVKGIFSTKKVCFFCKYENFKVANMIKLNVPS